MLAENTPVSLLLGGTAGSAEMSSGLVPMSAGAGLTETLTNESSDVSDTQDSENANVSPTSFLPKRAQ